MGFEWVKNLGGLPEAVALLVVAAIMIITIVGYVLRAVFKRVVDPMAESHRATAETLKSAIDTNTEAVKKSVDHNETIITNHLSGQEARDRRKEERDEVLIEEMRGVASAIQDSNQRRRVGD